jgi:hypothetical protein
VREAQTGTACSIRAHAAVFERIYPTLPAIALVNRTPLSVERRFSPEGRSLEHFAYPAPPGFFVDVPRRDGVLEREADAAVDRGLLR